MRFPRLSWHAEHRTARSTDHAGGAVSLVVILMVPVAAFAAVVAMAVPQRLAAESSLEDTAADLATMAAAWRDAQGRDDAPLDTFPGDCADVALTGVSQRTDIPEDFTGRLRNLCEAMSEAVLRDLGEHGFDPSTLRGFYSGSYATATGAPAGWSLPCSTGNGTVVTNAVHAGVVAHWEGPGWAAAQAMPDGIPMGAEAVGHVVRTDSGDTALPPCGSLLSLVPHRLRSAGQEGQSGARELAEAVPARIPFAG
ncbi:hypothetical protein [Candidatus Poriferisodalis sp.]|uniref:hypothetical protein n=1 Tax=Candidatus Poriferisodalis sp. TaxID=3101277 RepID=UPI003B016EB4